MNRFSFRPHKFQDGERRTHGLVDVYLRESGEMIGMLNPTSDGGYALRDCEGVRIGDICYTSRDTAAANLKFRVGKL